MGNDDDPDDDGDEERVRSDSLISSLNLSFCVYYI